jgi:hypothetical protein
VNPCLSPCHVSKDITLPNEEPKLNVLELALELVAKKTMILSVLFVSTITQPKV